MNDMKPVAYLDVDDTLIDWSTGYPKAGPGAKEFLLALLEKYEVRWLTYWCPDGVMSDYRAVKLGEILGVDPLVIQKIRGLNWEWSMDKQDGIAWSEVQAGREFVWIEDGGVVGDNLRGRLAVMGLSHAWKCCDLTIEIDAIIRTHGELFDDLHEEGRMETTEGEAERTAVLERGAEESTV